MISDVLLRLPLRDLLKPVFASGQQFLASSFRDRAFADLFRHAAKQLNLDEQRYIC